jgi:hypothetical protein
MRQRHIASFEPFSKTGRRRPIYAGRAIPSQKVLSQNLHNYRQQNSINSSVGEKEHFQFKQEQTRWKGEEADSDAWIAEKKKAKNVDLTFLTCSCISVSFPSPIHIHVLSLFMSYS